MKKIYFEDDINICEYIKEKKLLEQYAGELQRIKENLICVIEELRRKSSKEDFEKLLKDLQSLPEDFLPETLFRSDD